MQYFYNFAVGREGGGAASQDHSIAGLQAQPGSIYRHIRTSFINDADNAERHADFLN
ncbi:hypothetical protein D3C80_1687990 [compost metagenome]